MSRAGSAVSLDAGVLKYLIIVAALESFVAKEVDLVEIARSEELQAVRLVPTLGKHIEGDLASDRILKFEMVELLC